MGETQVHDHQTKVVREGVRYEEPRTRQVLKPDLRLVRVTPVHQSQTTILYLRIDIKGCNVLPSENENNNLTVIPQSLSEYPPRRMSPPPLQLMRT